MQKIFTVTVKVNKVSNSAWLLLPKKDVHFDQSIRVFIHFHHPVCHSFLKYFDLLLSRLALDAANLYFYCQGQKGIQLRVVATAKNTDQTVAFLFVFTFQYTVSRFISVPSFSEAF